MKIGTLDIKSDVIVAPMAGVTDLPFRQICRKFHQGLVVSEMVSISALYYKDKKTPKLMTFDPNEKPVALQVFTADVAKLEVVMDLLNTHNHDILDFNMGCPAPKIVNNGEGSALMKSPKLAEALLKLAVRKSNKPVTVKFRKGWDAHQVNAVEFAKMAEACGVSAIAIHGRTREQFYSGHADWDIIRQIKAEVRIPVIGNGDVFTVEDAVAMKAQTGCDGVMIGRGIQGNPWLLAQIDAYFTNGILIPLPENDEKLKVAQEHFEKLVHFKGVHTAILEMRKHAAWYFKGLKKCAVYRNEINQAKSVEEVQNILMRAFV